MKTNRRIAFGVLTLATAAFLAGCGARHSDKEVYYLISANSALPYWQTAAAGFKQAAAQYKVTAKVVGPDGYDPQAELAELQKATAAKPAGILISVSDISVLQPGIDAAVNAGVPVITMDSDAAGSRRAGAERHPQQPAGWAVGWTSRNSETRRQGKRRLLHHLRPAEY